jgi:deoxyribodipyrimidine photo-lyase
MHNRVEHGGGKFLTKYLLWMAWERLLRGQTVDFELSSNNGGWQWASRSGCDAAPYFRVFNPKRLLEKFDLIKVCEEMVQSTDRQTDVHPLVVRRTARQRALQPTRQIGGSNVPERPQHRPNSSHSHARKRSS